MTINDYIQDKLKTKKLTLMTHLIAGYPSFDDNWRALEIMIKRGVDLVEIQMPFSEPMADGPLFVKANQESLKNGTNWDRYFKFFAKAASTFDIPFLFMGYYNSVYLMGEDRFLERLTQVGGKGFIIPDLALPDGTPFFRKALQIELAPIMIIAPNTTPSRLEEIIFQAGGFLYLMARRGVTGNLTEFDTDFEKIVTNCRQLTHLPLGVGFGLSTVDQLKFLVGKVELAIIGSAILKSWMAGGERALDELLAGFQTICEKGS